MVGLLHIGSLATTLQSSLVMFAFFAFHLQILAVYLFSICSVMALYGQAEPEYIGLCMMP